MLLLRNLICYHLLYVPIKEKQKKKHEMKKRVYSSSSNNGAPHQNFYSCRPGHQFLQMFFTSPSPPADIIDHSILHALSCLFLLLLGLVACWDLGAND